MTSVLTQPGGIARDAISAARRPAILVYAIADRGPGAFVQTVGVSKRPWIGIQIQNVDEEYAHALGLSDANGALIVAVEDGGPAAAAGLVVGDVILAVENQPTDSPRELAKRISGLAPGTQTTIKINRNGEMLPVSVTICVRPEKP